MSFPATPAFSSAALTLPMRVVASAFARVRLGSCASTPTTTRPRSGEAETRPSPEAWTVRGAFEAGSGGAWARSTTTARTRNMVSSTVSGTPYATPHAKARRRIAPPARLGKRGCYSQCGVPKTGSLHFLPEPQSESRLQTHLLSLHLALLHWESFVHEALMASNTLPFNARSAAPANMLALHS